MFSLSSNTLDDGMLEVLFEQLPSRCIVLLEDIDSAGLKRESMRSQKLKKKRKSHSRPVYDEFGHRIYEEDEEDRGGVTLSGLLNVLDGIHSKEGMLTIMTSNSPDSLDPALVRPGRIDRKVLFGYCSKEVLEKLFKHIFEKAPEELTEVDTVDAGGQAAAHRDISKMAETFAKQVPADKLTPAEVQGFLLVHRDDPEAAVNEIAEWAAKTIERKAAGANVDTFASETAPAEGDGEDGDEEGHDSAVDFAELEKDGNSDASTQELEVDPFAVLAPPPPPGLSKNHISRSSASMPPMPAGYPNFMPTTMPPLASSWGYGIPTPPISRTSSSSRAGKGGANGVKKSKTSKKAADGRVKVKG
jgi:hypothetical protein